MKNIAKKITILLAIIILIVSATFMVACGKEDRVEDKIYDLVLTTAYTFKSPSSVRVLSGYVKYINISEEKDTTSYSEFEKLRGYSIECYVKISATNGYGAITTAYYQLYYSKDGTAQALNLQEMIDYCNGNGLSILTPLYEEEIEKAKSLDNFDYDYVNKKLANKWESLQPN